MSRRSLVLPIAGALVAAGTRVARWSAAISWRGDAGSSRERDRAAVLEASGSNGGGRAVLDPLVLDVFDQFVEAVSMARRIPPQAAWLLAEAGGSPPSARRRSGRRTGRVA
ncbi:MAG TPA: hypothetical protein VFS33_05470 [Gemmatimonadales bacterium]|nr:hypothetical protein [Gemmatimonadales bacterium]